MSESSKPLQLLGGLVLVASGIFLVFSPHEVASALGRPHETPPEIINARATFGGTVIGLGAFAGWLPALKPWRRLLFGLLLWLMAGIGVARLTGFILDGSPDILQWVWLVAEALLVLLAAVALRGRARERQP